MAPMCFVEVFGTRIVPMRAYSPVIAKPAYIQTLRGALMATEYLRDDHYHIIGTIVTESSGKQIARDARYNRVGEYDPKSDLTRDSHYRIIGTGNQLSALIWRTVR
jgi:hypothetical protein